LLVCGFNSDNIMRYNENGTPINPVATSQFSPLVTPREMVIGPDGLLYVIARDLYAILRFDIQASGEFIDVFINGHPQQVPQPEQLVTPSALLFLPDGTLLVAAAMG